MNDDDVVVARASGREAVEELRSSGALDALFERLDAGEIEMTGSQGLLPALLKEALERGLAAELTEHLGYEKGQTSTQARSNTRNGTTKKTVISEVGAFEMASSVLAVAGTGVNRCRVQKGGTPQGPASLLPRPSCRRAWLVIHVCRVDNLAGRALLPRKRVEHW